MNHFPLKKMLLLSLLTVAAMGGAGVASAKKATANLAAFADQTVALLGQPDYGLTSDEVVLVRGYYDINHPAVKKLDELSQRGASMFAALGDYSVHIAGLSGQRISEAERIQRLHSYLQEAKPDILAATEFQSARYDQILESIAAQEDFLAAIREVQPVINAVGRYGQLLISDYEDTVLEVRDILDAAIEEDYADLYAYGTWLNGHRDAVLTDLEALIEAEAEGKDITSQEEELIDRLEIIHGLAMEIKPHWQTYRDTQHELDKIHVDVLDASNRTRMVLLIWSRAHARMSTGRIQEAEWFTLQDLGAVAFKYGKKLL